MNTILAVTELTGWQSTIIVVVSLIITCKYLTGDWPWQR